MTTGPRSNAPHLVVGLCFILLGVSLVLDRLGVMEIGRMLAYWPVVLILLGVSMMVQSVRAPGRTDFPVGPLILLVLIALVASRAFEPRALSGLAARDDITLSAIFSGHRGEVTDSFQAARLTSVMGGTVLDLRGASIPAGQDAVIDVFALMGGVVVHVPPDWVVDIQSTVVMAGVEDERGRAGTDRPRRRQGPGARWDAPADAPPVPDLSPPAAPDAAAATRPEGTPAPRLVIRGFVMMGGLAIKP